MRFKTFMGAMTLSGLSLVSTCYAQFTQACMKLEGKALQDAQNVFEQKANRVQANLVALDQESKKLSPTQLQAVQNLVNSQVDALADQLAQQKSLLEDGIACPFPNHDKVLTSYKQALDSITQRAAIPSKSTKDPRSRFAAQSAQVFRVAIMDAKPDRFASYILQFRPRTLKLNSLGLTSLPAWFPQVNLSEVENLDLSGNKLSDLRPLRNMVNLINLNVANNSLSTLEGLENLPKLQGLYASSNRLSQSVKNGYLQHLPASVMDLVLDFNGFGGTMPLLDNPNLKRISLNNNKISNVCQAIVTTISDFPFTARIYPMTLMQLELGNTNLDADSQQCLLKLKAKRAAQNNPIKILPENLLPR